MKFNPFVLWMSLAALGLSACENPPEPQPSSMETQSRAIVGGDTEQGHPAVGALTFFGDAFCTGTLISPDVVVTAAHCLEGARDPEGFGFFLGTDARQPSSGTTIPAIALHAHPRYGQAGDNDVGVMVLSRSAPVTPVALQRRSMGDEWVGRNALFVGYGVTQPDTNTGGLKRSVTIPIDEVDGTRFLYSGRGINTCFGDSGGPALFRSGNQWTLIGVTSWGDEQCQDFGVNARVDPYLDFIDQFTQGARPEPINPSEDDFENDDDGFVDTDNDFDGPDEDFGRDCDPEFWDEACDAELEDQIDDLIRDAEDLLAGDGTSSGGCQTAPLGSGRSPSGTLWIFALLAIACARRFT